MELEKYLKACFPDSPHLNPIDISEEVLKRLPKYEFGILTDPVIRNVAWGISIVLIIFGAWLRFNPPQPAELQSRISPGSLFTTEEAEQLKIKLPDNSRLMLKEKSLLEIKRLLPQIELKLNHGGLLLFVAESALRKSFSLYTPQVEIRVLGTRFKVLADGEKTEVVVLEGKVEIEIRDYLKDETLLILNQLERMVFDRKNERKLAVKPLLTEEIEALKNEFGLSEEKQGVRKRFPVLWREIREPTEEGKK